MGYCNYEVPHTQTRWLSYQLRGWCVLGTINTRRKATGGLPDHQTPFVPHILIHDSDDEP